MKSVRAVPVLSAAESATVVMAFPVPGSPVIVMEPSVSIVTLPSTMPMAFSMAVARSPRVVTSVPTVKVAVISAPPFLAVRVMMSPATSPRLTADVFCRSVSSVPAVAANAVMESSRPALSVTVPVVAMSPDASKFPENSALDVSCTIDIPIGIVMSPTEPVGVTMPLIASHPCTLKPVAGSTSVPSTASANEPSRV